MKALVILVLAAVISSSLQQDCPKYPLMDKEPECVLDDNLLSYNSHSCRTDLNNISRDDFNDEECYQKQYILAYNMMIKMDGEAMFEMDSVNISVRLNWDESFDPAGVMYKEMNELINGQTGLNGEDEDDLFTISSNLTLFRLNRCFNVTEILYVTWWNDTEDIAFQTILVTNEENDNVYILVLTKYNGKLNITVTAGGESDMFNDSQKQDAFLWVYNGSHVLRALIENVRITEEGFVEVRNNLDDWGAVCDDRWGNKDAKVVCRQLGKLSYEAKATHNGIIGSEANVTYFMDDVKCEGHEKSIFDCIYATSHNCEDGERAGVSCFENDVEVYPKSGNGEVKIRIGTVMVSVCPNFWTNDDAKVACKQINPNYTGGRVDARDGSNEMYSIDYVNCKGDEPSLLDCLHIFRPHGCYGPKRAYVQCF